MIKGLLLSLQFFTRLPININIDFNKKNIGYSVFFLPLVGLIIGGLGGLVYWFVQPYSSMIASLLGLITTILLTGGLHLDGLSDTFDGFLSNRKKEEVFRIMEDSRIGAFGVLSLILIILFKYILILNTPSLALALALSFANSRLVIAWTISRKATAKAGGLGKLFKDSNPKRLVIASTIIYLAIIILLDIRYLFPLILNIFLGEYISHISKKKIGGLTGDVYGCIIELGDAISLLGFWGLSLWI